MSDIEYIDWGLINYKDAWEKQKIFFNELIEQKSNFEDRGKKLLTQRFIVCEHPHVYTLGKNGQINNLLINDEFLNEINASYYQTDRGGDITYHGYGQIVGYPILDLEQLHLSLKDYVHTIEEAIILTLNEYQIKSSRLDKATGVWLDATGKNPRKICAIGIRASRYVTMHGFALNVNTDLSYFSYINPCGFVDKGVTSMKKELKITINMDEVKRKIYLNFKLLVAGR